MYRRPAYYDRGSQPRFSTLQFSPRLASPRLASFLPPSSFPFHRSNRTIHSRIPFSASYFPPVSPARGEDGRVEGEGAKKRRQSSGSRITGKEVIENAVPVYRCPYVYLPFINSRSDNFFSKLRDSGVTHVDTYIGISVSTVYPYTRGNENDRYFSILLEDGRIRLRISGNRRSEMRVRRYRGGKI